MVPLGEVASIDRSVVEPWSVPGETRYLGLEHIERGGRITGSQTVSASGVRSTKFRFASTQVLFGKLRPNLGKVARPSFGGLCSTDILPISPGSELDRDYLAHYLSQPCMVALAASRATGANLPRLSPSVLASFEIPLPPLPEQRRIAAILDKADALRTKRRQVLAHLDTLPHEFFRQIFGSREWPVAPLQSVATMRLGKMLDSKRQSGEMPARYLRNANVQWFSIATEDLYEMDFDERERVQFALRGGDVLVCEGGQPGRSAVWRGAERDVFFQKALHRVRLSDDVDPDYFVYFMWSAVHGGELKDFVTSATIAHLTGEKLRTLPIKIPPRELQQQFVRRVHAIGAARLAAGAAQRETDQLFASLQSRAFNGQL